jgi:hypothetical protein
MSTVMSEVVKVSDADEVAPDASQIFESLRAGGYTLATAIADIIDNSIAAPCRNIRLRFEWDGDNSWISITDDGKGMSEDELVNAMRLGSRNPLEERDPDDLGRFGLGMKTASLSQARRLTVITRPNRKSTFVRRWDLDHLAKPDVKGWQLLRTPHPDTGSLSRHLDKLETGTVVLLEILDRVISVGSENEIEGTEDYWVSEVALVRQHLGMVFHRFLTDPPEKKIKIFINDNLIEPWDPFCKDLDATQLFPAESNSDFKGIVEVKGFVLPHRDRFDLHDNARSKELHHAASGPEGWNAQQGFYLYRNRRLIIPGDWLKLGPGRNGWNQEEHYKLARIQVDIPNTMDGEWKIDIKKSTAEAPQVLQAWLTGLAKTVREKAKNVYAHRGGRTPRKTENTTSHSHPWVTRTRSDGNFSYRIDRKHPLFQTLIESLTADDKQELETLLRLIEETVPVQRIWIDTADNQDGVAAAFEHETSRNLRKYISIVFKSQLARGETSAEAWRKISEFPGFETVDARAIIGQLQEGQND